MRKLILIISIMLLLTINVSFGGVTGKITGVITDVENGQPLAGANTNFIRFFHYG